MDLNSIKIFAKEKHITIKELSEKIGMSERGLHKSIKNNSISAEYLEKIAHVLDISVSTFFENDKNKETEKYCSILKAISETDKNDIIKDYNIFFKKLPKFNDVSDFNKQLNDIDETVCTFANKMRIKYPIIKILSDNAQIIENTELDLTDVFYVELLYIIEMYLYSGTNKIGDVLRPLLLSKDAELKFEKQSVKKHIEEENLNREKELKKRVLNRVKNLIDNNNTELINKIINEEWAEMTKFDITSDDFNSIS